MILASAIKYINKKENKEVILCGSRHGDIFKQAEILNLDSLGYVDECQGFIDHKNNFLTRKEAFEHAKMCGQISEKIVDSRESGNCIGGLNMISEDLW